MESRLDRTAIARATVRNVDEGFYLNASGDKVDLCHAVVSCVAQTREYDPDEMRDLLAEVSHKPSGDTPASIEVVNETTLEGISRIRATNTTSRVFALNFASAKNAGGGFLGGAQAQEESLARSSALYASLLKSPKYYARHRNASSLLYSHSMILSPECPIFRDDAGNVLDAPQFVTWITSPAPNAGAIRQNTPADIPRIQPVLEERAEMVLALAAHHDCEVLVLGAWGCGVFRNDPQMVAEVFAELLKPEGRWVKRFARVVFSVLDRSKTQETIGAFQEHLGKAAG